MPHGRPIEEVAQEGGPDGDRRPRPERRVYLETLVVTVGVSRVDLHGEDRVWGGELGAFSRGGVLNQVRNADDAKAAGLSVSELHAAAIRVIGDEVSSDLTCWAAIDP